ncbi:hypothetical protein N7505_004121 [Penicillium chrysogenum]|uniref:Uncharacterized protein n=1 Tax=Penicillium chrysogenum TaxID=5076 RepID=A0ABQ8WS48_PENCH|nr:hypothetical protein N7505_004121 [Penicillium chrysogenum]
MAGDPALRGYIPKVAAVGCACAQEDGMTDQPFDRYQLVAPHNQYLLGLPPLSQEIHQLGAWDCPEAVEITEWTKILSHLSNPLISTLETPLNEFIGLLGELRHSAVHQLRKARVERLAPQLSFGSLGRFDSIRQGRDSSEGAAIRD